MRTIGEGSCGKTVDCGVEFTGRRDLPARFSCGRQKQVVAVPVSHTRIAKRLLPLSRSIIQSVRPRSAYCEKNRPPDQSVRHRTLPVLPRHPAATSSAPNESCRNRFSGLNRPYNAGQNDRPRYSGCLGKAEFGTPRKPPGSKPQPGRVATRHLFPAFAKGPSQDSRSFAEVKHAARGHPYALRWQLAECGNHFVTQAPAVDGRVTPHSIGIGVEHRLRFLDRYPQVRQPR